MGTSVSRAIMAHARTIFAALAALALALTFAPSALFADDSVAASSAQAEASSGVASALADQLNASTDLSSKEPQRVSASQVGGSSDATPTLASALAGPTASIVSADVALDSAEPVIGSFTVDGLTYALNDGGVTLVSVAGPLAGPEGEGSAEGGFTNISIPSSATYDDAAYDVTAIGPYAFYLSGAASVELPESIASVDDRAFRSSDVGRVEVDQANPTIASFDGCLYDSQLLSLLLIPEGRAGAVLLPETAEVVEASKFSHCSLVDAISVGEGGAAFASWEGLLYDAFGTTLLRVPAGATDITIRDGCTTIAAGAMEGCAKLERISAPASIVSISPDVFESVPTVGLPIASALQDGSQDDSVAGPLAGPGYEGDARSASADSPAEGEAATQPSSQDEASSGVASGLPDQVNASTDSSDAEGEAEVSPRRVVAESQGLSAPLALPDLGSTSASPSAEASGSATQLTAMVALSSTGDSISKIEPSSIAVNLSGKADAAPWEHAGFANVVFGMKLEGEGGIGSSAAPANTDAASTYAAIPDFKIHSPLTACTIQVDYKTRPGFPEHTEIVTLAAGEAYVPPYAVTDWNRTIWPGAYNGDSYITIRFSDDAPWRWVDCWIHADGVAPATVFTDDSVTLPLHSISDGTTTWYESEYQTSGSAWCLWRAPIGIKLDHGNGSKSAEIFEYYGEGFFSTPNCATRLSSVPVPSLVGYRFCGYWTSKNGAGSQCIDDTGNLVVDAAFVENTTLYAQWEPYEIGFDVDSEPGDAGYPGTPKDPVSGDAVGPDGTIAIEDPKRPGYVFEGWVIPNADGTEAIDQELVYQGDDGKWYVDASKLPDYAGDDGRVELTARWTSVISVDVPSSVTFYADLVTQGQESREGAASGGAADGAFGQSKVSNQSEVDLRIVGLESSAVKTTDSTLGADSVLKKADAATPSTSTQKLLSLYPSTKQWTAGELQDPDAVGGSKAATAVDFDLDDILLEKSFKADDFTIASGGTLNMGYRLNLSETGQQLDYDKLSTLSEGQSASIANVSYCFSADMVPVFWTIDDDGDTLNVFDIKNDAKKISAGDAATIQKYTTWMNSDHRFYVRWFDKGIAEESSQGESSSTVYEVRILGLNHDTKADGSGKAGITFQLVNCLNQTFPFVSGSSVTSWSASSIRAQLNSGAIWSQMPMRLRNNLEMVTKVSYDKGSRLSTQDKVFLISLSELITPGTVWPDGTDTAANGWGELAQMRTVNPQYAFWKAKGINGKESNSLLVKQVNGAAYLWVTRSVSFAKDSSVGYAASVNNTGIPNGSGTISNQQKVGISPVFCL